MPEHCAGSASSSTPIPLGSSLASTAASAVYCRACAAHGRARHCTFGRATPTVRRSYIHISRVSDERVDKLEKKFKVGQVRHLTGGLSESLTVSSSRCMASRPSIGRDQPRSRLPIMSAMQSGISARVVGYSWFDGILNLSAFMP